MREYERNYEDWDEYEEDGEEEEEGAEDGYEEEPEPPTEEQLEYLELRQRLKDKIRKQRGIATACPRGKTNTYRKDDYGSFFGPSQPVIAQRVIQESKSLLENPDLAARLSKPSHNHTNNNKSRISAPVRPKSQPSYRPSATNGVKRKAEMLKSTRDYSFLLSDDAEVPAPSRSPPPRNVSTPKSDARPAQPQQRSKEAVIQRGREVSNGRDVRKPMPASSQSRAKSVPEKVGHARKLPPDHSGTARKQLGSNSGSGPGRPLVPKNMPSKSPVRPPAAKAPTAVARNTVVGRVQKPTTPSPMQSVVRKPTASNPPPGIRRPTPSSGQPSVSRRPVQKEYQETQRPNAVAKQTLPPSSRDQMKRPVSKPPVRSTSVDQRPKPAPKRQLRDEDSDGENAISMIRQMFRYNPNKFRDDDDVSDMEANFEDIQREEKRSAKIARKEDEEQLRLIEEEEKRERMRMAKKRKMGH
ncbi:hypothetical protein ABFS82_12G023900 [Erythranthe guttata]